MKSTRFHIVTSLSLLLLLAPSLIQLESFHHHEQEEQVCTEAETHIEEPGFECDLGDFVLPKFQLARLILLSPNFNLLTEFNQTPSFAFEQEAIITRYSRGPPSLKS